MPEETIETVKEDLGGPVISVLLRLSAAARVAQTRERVGNEIDVISYKTDLGARVGDYVDDTKEAAKSKIIDAKSTVTGVVPDGKTLKRGMNQVRSSAQANPVGLALGGLAVSFAVGTLLPQTRIENEQLGEVSERLTTAARDAAADAVDRGKHAATDAINTAIDTAQHG